MNKTIEDLPGEVWKDMVGFEDLYQISNLGRCKSIGRYRPLRNGEMVYKEACILSPQKAGANNNPSYSIRKRGERRGRLVAAARLMYEAFVGQVPSEMQVTIPFGQDCILENVVLIKRGSTKVAHTDKDARNIPYSVGDIYRQCKILDIVTKYRVVNSSRSGTVQTPTYTFVLECGCGEAFSVRYLYGYRNKPAKCMKCKAGIDVSVEDGFTYHEGAYIGNVLLLKDLGNREFLCKCGYCSREFTGNIRNIRRRTIPSCGCKNILIKEELFLLGIDARHPIYVRYKNMIQHCYSVSKSDKNYLIYRGKEHAYSGSVKVCRLWLNSFTSFYNWVMENGYTQDKNIVRIDSNGDFVPFNIQLISRSEHAIKTDTYDIEVIGNEELYETRKKIYKEKEARWVSEMVKKGYKKEDLI